MPVDFQRRGVGLSSPIIGITHRERDIDQERDQGLLGGLDSWEVPLIQEGLWGPLSRPG